MATVVLPEKNILPIKDIDQSAIRPADERTLGLLRGRNTIQYSPSSTVHLSGNLGAGTISGLGAGTISGPGAGTISCLEHLALGAVVPSIAQEISLLTVNELLKIFDLFFLSVSAEDFYILHADNPVCWRWTDDEHLKAAELLKSDSMELKGMIENKHFKAGEKYDVEFLIKMDKNAELNTKSRFTVVLPELEGKCSIHSNLVNLKEQVKADEWMFVKVGDFIATENGEHLSFSLTNFDQYWKKGLAVAGVLVQPSTIA